MYGQHEKPALIDRLLRSLIWVCLLALILLMLFSQVLGLLSTLQDRQNPEPDPQGLLERAEDAIASAERILSFLEGSTLLVVLGLGAAALFGYRNTRELKEDLKEQIDTARSTITELEAELRGRMDEIENLRRELNEARPLLARLPDQLAQVEQASGKVDEAIAAIQPNFVDLLQASQELNLKNYDEAYRAVSRVLERSPHNLQGLYIAGWLEIQYIPNKLPDGLRHLKLAVDLDPDSPSLRAAYGVALRRQARDLPDPQRRDLFTQAEGHLRQALGQNHNLIDLNRESYWGPVGGILRDMNRIHDAIAAYEQALKITPGSSYPQGNLASLRLLLAKDDPSLHEIALDEFARTHDYAQRELAFMPKDYYLMMDVAMSSALLGQRDPQAFQRSLEWLETALSTDSACGMLNVSLSGWKRLADSCPLEWENVLAHLEACIARLEAAISERCT